MRAHCSPITEISRPSLPRLHGELGMALAREIAKAHGGRLQLANREGSGLDATLVLPLR